MMEFAAGAQLGNYRLLRLIGVGGFAQVYLAQHVYLETQAAIKVLGFNADIDRFLKEARTIARLRHPSIVSVLEFGIEREIERPYLVMEYAPHGSLRAKHPKGASLPLSTVVSYVRQVAAALQYAHEHRVIHCDVKPENMLIGEDEQVLLSDFGIARVLQNTLQSQTAKDIVGTIYYMAPEQFAGKPVASSDQYALGVVVYEWLSGQPPFDGSNIAEIFFMHTRMDPPPLDLLDPAIPPAVAQVVMKTLTKEPKQRYSNIAAFATALEQAAQTTQATPQSFSVGFSAYSQGAPYLQDQEQPTLPEIVLPEPSLPAPVNSIETLLPSLLSYLPADDATRGNKMDVKENSPAQFVNPQSPQLEPGPLLSPFPSQSIDYDLVSLPLPALTDMLPPTGGISDEPTVPSIPSVQEPSAPKPAPEPGQELPPAMPLQDVASATGLLPTLINFLPLSPPPEENQADVVKSSQPAPVEADPKPEAVIDSPDSPALPQIPEDQSPTVLLQSMTLFLKPEPVTPPRPEQRGRLELHQVEIFISYSHKDRSYREKLDEHLSQIKQHYPATVWYDGVIRPGVDFQQEIEMNLQKAHIILLLVSSHFISSDYCSEKELKPAMERHHMGEARVIPVILRPTLWQIAPFGKLQALPRDGKPISLWKPSDIGYADVAKGIEQLIRDMLGISPQLKVLDKSRGAE